MSRILVTGASGLIGRQVLPLLVQRGHDVHAVARRTPEHAPEDVSWHRLDLLEPGAAAETIARVAPERLLHLAWYAEHGLFWQSTENVRWVEATLALLRAFADGDGRRAVLAGTCAEYDWGALGQDGTNRESSACREQDTPLAPATLYGASKHAVHLVAERYLDQVGIELAWGRIFFLYGPGEQAGRLVPSIVTSLLRGRETPTSDGSQVRDFMHVGDVAGAFAALIDSDCCGSFNVASGQAVTVREVVETIAALTGSAQLVRWGALPRPPADPPALVADVTRLREEVRFVPSLTLQQGLESTIAWWRERFGG